MSIRNAVRTFYGLRRTWSRTSIFPDEAVCPTFTRAYRSMRERWTNNGNILPCQQGLAIRTAQVSSISNGVCWKCSKILTSSSKFFCEHCATILPPADIDFFKVLDVNNSFEVSTDALQKSFKESQVQQVYETIMDELCYMLTMYRAVHDHFIQSAGAGISIEEDTQMDDPEFLMEVMELNEQIADAEGNKSLVKIQSQIKGECNKLIDELSNAFKAERLDDAKTLLIRLRYFNNMSEKLRHLIPPT